jgi:hypothetical protein
MFEGNASTADPAQSSFFSSPWDSHERNGSVEVRRDTLWSFFSSVQLCVWGWMRACANRGRGPELGCVTTTAVTIHAKIQADLARRGKTASLLTVRRAIEKLEQSGMLKLLGRGSCPTYERTWRVYGRYEPLDEQVIYVPKWTARWMTIANKIGRPGTSQKGDDPRSLKEEKVKAGSCFAGCRRRPTPSSSNSKVSVDTKRRTVAVASGKARSTSSWGVAGRRASPDFRRETVELAKQEATRSQVLKRDTPPASTQPLRKSGPEPRSQPRTQSESIQRRQPWTVSEPRSFSHPEKPSASIASYFAPRSARHWLQAIRPRYRPPIVWALPREQQPMARKVEIPEGHDPLATVETEAGSTFVDDFELHAPVQRMELSAIAGLMPHFPCSRRHGPYAPSLPDDDDEAVEACLRAYRVVINRRFGGRCHLYRNGIDAKKRERLIEAIHAMREERVSLYRWVDFQESFWASQHKEAVPLAFLFSAKAIRNQSEWCGSHLGTQSVSPPTGREMVRLYHETQTEALLCSSREEAKELITRMIPPMLWKILCERCELEEREMYAELYRAFDQEQWCW